MAQLDQNSWANLPLAVQSFALEEFNVREVVKHAKKMGLQYIEFFHGHLWPYSSADTIAETAKVLEREGVSISAYGLHTFTDDHEANRKAFDFARKLKIKNITADVEPAAFNSLSKLVEEYGVRVCIHTSGPGSRYEKLETLVGDLKDKHKLIGACVDTGHVLRGGDDPSKWIRALGARVFALHLNDVAEKVAQTYSMPLGRGHLRLDEVRKALLEVRFPSDGSIAVGYRAAACARLFAPIDRPNSALGPLIQSMNAILGNDVVAWPPSPAAWE